MSLRVVNLIISTSVGSQRNCRAEYSSDGSFKQPSEGYYTNPWCTIRSVLLNAINCTVSVVANKHLWSQ